MDDLLKQLQGMAGQSGSGPSGSTPASGDPLGGLGGLLGGGGLGSVLGGALGGGLGGSLGGGSGAFVGGLGALLPTLVPAVLGLLGSHAGAGRTGMHQLLDGMHTQGLGDIANSWVGTGENLPISPAQVQQALGADKLQQLSASSGLPTGQVAEGLAAVLPGLVNHLTPNGQVPAADQVQSAVSGLQGLLGGLAPR
jgi:uncharacterized protein YidB (DUF937 family)